ncbi:MAG: phage holin family protein, partial [Chitinispirillaceae bacterium]|nr:phage holin family protein [Chitinispirillaceae bacterium]
KYTIAAIISLLAPIKGILITTSLLIFADTITGILAAYKRNEEINSTGFKKTIIKLFLYNLVIVLAFLIEKFIFDEFIPFVKIGAMVIALTEFKSVLENFEDITGIKMTQIKQLIEQKAKGESLENKNNIK